MFDDKSCVVRSSAVVARGLRDQTLLMDMESERYLTLDAVASHIWSMLDGTQSVAHIAATIVDEYDAPAPTIRADIDALLTELFALGLVHSAA
ncbi:MAG: PqqD family protein [Acidimicrobiales bacterium]